MILVCQWDSLFLLAWSFCDKKYRTGLSVAIAWCFWIFCFKTKTWDLFVSGKHCFCTCVVLHSVWTPDEFTEVIPWACILHSFVASMPQVWSRQLPGVSVSSCNIPDRWEPPDAKSRWESCSVTHWTCQVAFKHLICLITQFAHILLFCLLLFACFTYSNNKFVWLYLW